MAGRNRTTLFCCLAVLLSICARLSSAACPDAATGLTTFSSVASWQTKGANVFIAKGQQVLLDKSTVALGGITINGTLIIKNDIININALWIRVNNGGKLIAGSSDCPIDKKVTITLSGNRTTTNLIGTDVDRAEFGSKGLAVFVGGILQLYGYTQGPSWTNLAATATAGSKTLTLAQSVSWRAGDQLVVASTDFPEVLDSAKYPGSAYRSYVGPVFPDQNEYVTIASVSGNVVTLTAPLNYTHWGKDDERAEVGLLTRRIVIQGDDSSESQAFGGHLMMRQNGKNEISGVEFTRMGQQGLLARYPVHFHMMGEVYGQGHFVHNCSIHHNYQRCLTIHESHGVSVRDNVAFHTFGHCYFLEEGGERGSILDRNLGVYAKPLGNETGRQVIPTDSRPSIFWITNPNNTFTRNAAVSGNFGYWFSLPAKPIGLAARFYVNDTTVLPRSVPLKEFSDNVAHTIHDSGLFIDDMLNPDGTTNSGAYAPRETPVFSRITSYKCRGFGVWGRHSHHYTGLKLMDNRVGLLVNGYTMVEQSLFIGETDNIGVPRNKYHSRGYPSVTVTNSTQILGHSTYDAGGPQFSRHNVFRNYVHRPDRYASGVGPMGNAPFMLDTKNRFLNLTFQNANEVFLNYRENDAEWGWTVLDLDGSTTGITGGAWIVSNVSHLLNSNCTFRSNWNAWACRPFPEGYVQLVVVNEDGSTPSNVSASGVSYTNTNLTSKRIIRTAFHTLGSSVAPAESMGSNIAVPCMLGSRCYQTQHNVLPRKGYAIRFKFNQYDVITPSKLTVTMESSSPGDYLIVAIPYPKGSTFVVASVNPAAAWTQASSFKTMTRNSYYYDTNTEHLYLVQWNFDDGTNPNTKWNQSNYEYWRPTTIVATCPGGVCGATKLAIPALPDIGLGEERYQATLQTCQLTNTVNANILGSAYVFLYPKNDTFTGPEKEAHFIVYHDLTPRAVDVKIMEGAIGQVGTEITSKKFAAPSASFVRGVFSLSRSQWLSLSQGKLYILVTTAQNPNGALRGQLQCKGTCTAPPAISTTDACSPTASILSVYSDTGASVSGWRVSDASGASSSGYTTSLKANHTTRLCGNSSMLVGLYDGQIAIGYKNINVSTTLYKSLEFYVKMNPGYGEWTFSVGWIDGASKYYYHKISTDYVQNYVIDEFGWTRVRVPLVNMGFASPVQTVRAILFTKNQYPLTYREMLIDEIRFTSATLEGPGTPVTVTTPQFNPNIC